MAEFMDDKFVVPGTRIRFGMDSLIGLLPGVGDAATAVAGIWLIIEGARLGVPFWTLIRMLMNLGVDVTVGSIPVLGDLFDVYWKSNRRNANLLEKHLPPEST